MMMMTVNDMNDICEPIRPSSPTSSHSSEERIQEKEGASSGRSLESKRRASRKKNQKRREAAKRSKALLRDSAIFMFDSVTGSPSASPSQESESTFSINTTPSSFDHDDHVSTPTKPQEESLPQLPQDLDSTTSSSTPSQGAPTISDSVSTPPEVIAADDEDKTDTTEESIAHAEDTFKPEPNAAMSRDQKATTEPELILEPQEPYTDNVVDKEEKCSGGIDIRYIKESPATGQSSDKEFSALGVEGQVLEHALPMLTLSESAVPDQDAAQDETEAISEKPMSENSTSNSSDWDLASETVATVAIRCLIKDKDMELSYVAILSAITVLQERQCLGRVSTPSEESSMIGELFSQLLRIMCRLSIAEGLNKETLHQGAMLPQSLYIRLYNAIQSAGFQLQDEVHLLMGQYLIDRKETGEALDCINHISSIKWTGTVFRAAITCHLFAKPRRLQEAEALLEKYIAFDDTAGQNDDGALAKTWFRLQLDASKWEDIKTQYERRRSRLLDAPSNIERLTASETEPKLTSQALQQHQLQEQQRSPQKMVKHERSASIASSSMSSGHQRSHSGQYSSPPGHQRTHSGHQRSPSAIPSWPSGASATLNAPTATPTAPATKGPFAFLSSLKFPSKSSDSEPQQAALPSRIHANHHLTVLDNGMLEECIAHKEFEYGWKHIYERMGPTLEDIETAKIAMKLCRRAFLGHGGLSSCEPGSPNILARNMHAEDLARREAEHETTRGSTLSVASGKCSDPEVWEARAWAIYNKAMMNPHAVLATSSAPQNPSNNANGSLSGASPVANSSAAIFLHDILTISINSPELSSRYLKAFKVYSAVRSDPQNQHHLRDPFVMSCMIKALYDAVLTIVQALDQPSSPENQSPEVKKHHRRSSSISLNRPQPITIGPLIDLAFEIYADMRQVGPIRHLPSLISLTPASPTSRTSRSSNRPIFFQSTTQPAAATAPTETAASASEPSDLCTISVVSTSPRPSFSAANMPVFQELNPTLEPNPQARRLSLELYLAMLHLCIQVPVYRFASHVVKTILSDLTIGSGNEPRGLDRHLAAAIQGYHDAWMCLQNGRTSSGSADESAKATSTGQCVYYQWMYQSDELIQKHMEEGDIQIQEGSGEENALQEGIDQRTCNDELYWDLWTEDDEALKSMHFSRRKATMLWKHVSQALL